MSTTVKEYDLSKVQLIVQTNSIGGYGAEGGVEITWDADVYDVKVGATGLTTASKINNKNALAKITVAEGSRAYALLAATQKLQEFSEAPVLLPVVFLMIDPSNGDMVNTANAIFVDRPTIAKGKTASDRVFKMHLPNAAVAALFGVTNLL